MKHTIGILAFLSLAFCCKKPFSTPSETALALPFKTVKITESVVFVAGFDEGDNTYYTNAKAYFEGKGMRVVDNLFSLNEIIGWLNTNGEGQVEYDEIHIVSHSNAWLGMSLKTTEEGKRITLKTLREAENAHELLDVTSGVTNATKIIFHSCGLGENVNLLQELKHTFTSQYAPKVYASPFFNVFGGKFSGHYLAKPYYVFYPTAESPGPAQLAKEFQAAYPETRIDWFTAMKTRKETVLGKPHSFKFNIPVNWEFDFDNATDIPQLKHKEAILDWISESPEMAEVLLELNIPLEKYRWKCKIQGKKLVIRAKTTVLCVLAPILQEEEYQRAEEDDRTLYQIL